MRDNMSPEEVMDSCEPLLVSGACILRDANIAKIVQDAMRYFEGQRYFLSAWCIMPNHVHAVITPLREHKLSDILHSWKSFSSNEINKFLGRTGILWERESFDRLIRTSEHFNKFIVYTEYNPVYAGFCQKPQEWLFSSCDAGFQPAFVNFIDPRQTPYAEIHTRGELPHLEKEGGSYFVTFCLADAIQSWKKKTHVCTNDKNKGKSRLEACTTIQTCTTSIKNRNRRHK